MMKRVYMSVVGLVIWSILVFEYLRLVKFLHAFTRNRIWTDQMSSGQFTSNSTSMFNAIMSFSPSSSPHSNATTNSNTRDTGTAPPDITAAICHKTLFGSLNYTRIIEWTHYHHDLGFDRIFIGYLPELAAEPGFAALQAVPYVTLYENNLSGPPRKYHTVRLVKHGPGSQDWDIEQCLSHYAKDFDWAIHSDCDEFLWFKEKTSLKEFLHQYNDYNYLSFGKYMYSPLLTPLSNVTKQQIQQPTWHTKRYSVGDYPFTGGPFCVKVKNKPRRRGDLYCPDYAGRSKIMVRPAKFSKFLDVHTSLPEDPVEALGQKHFLSNEVHLKEWPNIFVNNITDAAAFVPSRDFVATEGERDLMMHQFKGARYVVVT